MKISRRNILSLLFGFVFLTSLSFGQNQKPEESAKEIIAGIEKTVSEIKEGRLVLICFIDGSIEIVSTVTFVEEWTDEYRKLLESKVAITIKRGGTVFQLLQLKEEKKEFI